MRAPTLNIKCFHFDSFEYVASSRTALFHYSFDSQLRFTEKIIFPHARILSEPEYEALQHVLFYAHIMLGVSYFKAAVPPQIEIHSGTLSKRAADFFSQTYEQGLAEFAFVNGLSLKNVIKFPYDPVAHPQAAAAPLRRRNVVPLGGGKDSLVSLELLKQSEEEVLSLTMGNWTVIEELCRITSVTHLEIARQIDPTLLELNQQGALNGHVPFSAILAFILPACALLYDFDTVVMSQERSANVGSIMEDGSEVNHQYSKSFAFEKGFSDLLKSEILKDFHFFSLLRPLSELHITKLFSKLEPYHQTFTSCNRAFRLTTEHPERWCLDCPKCRFVFLMLAPFLSPERLQKIFGKNLLADRSQQAGFEDLLGLGKHKPLECVGEIEECRYALELLSAQAAWQAFPLLEELRSGVRSDSTLRDPSFPLKADFRAEHLIPPLLEARLHAAL